MPISEKFTYESARMQLLFLHINGPTSFSYNFGKLCVGTKSKK